MLALIDPHLIEPGTRLRGVNEEQVAAIVDSVAEVGILNPITVYARRVIRDHVSVDGYGLVAGLHRLEAVKRLGLAEVPAQVVDLSELQRQIAECDENLCGTRLSTAERAMFTRRRKEAYEALHPETKQEAFKGNQHTSGSRQLGDKQPDRFTKDTAKSTGQSERKVQRDAERGDKIDPDVMKEIKGSRHDKGVVLDILKKLSHAEQKQAVFRVKSGASAGFQDAYDFIKGEDRPAPKPVPPPDPPRNPNEAFNKWCGDMNRVWSRAPQDWREQWLDMIDRPVFDQTRAAS